MTLSPVFPTVLHHDAAEIVQDYFSAFPIIDTVLVVNSCARGLAVPESDLDFAILVRPDAIFTISDRMAIGAMLAIKEKGLTMPHDIGLVGFNNEPVTSLVTPQISSVEQPCFEMGKLAAKLFIETIHQDKDMSNVDVVLKTKLFVRQSSQRLAPKNNRFK